MTPTNDQPTPTSSLEEAWKDHRATIDATLPVVLNQARRDFNAGWAAARAEVMREGDEIDPRYRAWESIRPYPTDGGVITFPRFKAAWDRLRALSQGGEG